MRTLPYILLLPIVVIGVLAGQLYETSEGNKFYVETLYRFTWFEAVFECSYRNMSLYNFESESEYQELYKLLTSDKFKGKTTDLWLGAVGVKGQFMWIKTWRPMTEDHLWYPGNPDNSGGNENCLNLQTTNKTFNDYGCLNKLGFVCHAGHKKEATPKEAVSEGSGEGKYKGLTIIIKNN